VRAYDPFVPAGRAADLGVELMPDLESLLGEADVVSVHVPLMAKTRHMINAETIARMKPGAILVNTARGGLVDEAALLAALDSGQLSGAGLDVTDPEPPERDNPLLHRHEVIVTPHVASATTTGKSRIYRSAIEQALQVLRDERPPNVVNPAVWERRRRADS
jgi:D-3-phosphoglycerate dehydrogenase